MHTCCCCCCCGSGSKWWRYLNKLYRRLSMPHKISFAHFYVSFNYNSVVYKASIIIQCCLSNSYSNYSNLNDEHLFSLLQFGLSSPSKNSQASFHVCEQFRCGYFFLKRKKNVDFQDLPSDQNPKKSTTSTRTMDCVMLCFAVYFLCSQRQRLRMTHDV